ncbi:hypothetical protein SmJEL517_g05743 [Synchytrium microbalum]|uniref:Enoyl-CoA hydratase n=1 Tax=Synchytrium microbalum TaxID=1806994 RepID=A0A507BT02_9FUNG|nr:uncharacterized protein SmJEL517_g05743 [Synchytrium microbalum]TPX30772.1 hypothetical protein SmJEL517_g05743 [Synchytrium microbalum]
MTLEVDAAFAAAAHNPDVKVIVLLGKGDNFSSGHDLGTPERLADGVSDPLKQQGMRGDYEMWSSTDVEACLRWRAVKKPVVCGIQGYVVFHGVAVASVADVIFAADDLKMMPSLVEVTTLPWDLALNARRAKEIMFAQRFILAQEALELGLVNRVFPASKLRDEVVAYAKVVAKADGFHLWMMKNAVNGAMDSAGYTQNIRSNLNTWAAYYASLADPATQGKKAEFAASKRMAPIPGALTPEVMRWSENATLMKKATKL